MWHPVVTFNVISVFSCHWTGDISLLSRTEGKQNDSMCSWTVYEWYLEVEAAAQMNLLDEEIA